VIALDEATRISLALLAVLALVMIAGSRRP